MNVPANIDMLLDNVYDTFDDYFLEDNFDDADELVNSAMCIADFLPADILVGILEATLPARDRLENRPWFCQVVGHVLKDRGELEPGLLDGLK